MYTRTHNSSKNGTPKIGKQRPRVARVLAMRVNALHMKRFRCAGNRGENTMKFLGFVYFDGSIIGSTHAMRTTTNFVNVCELN